jgi:hypothetical protein
MSTKPSPSSAVVTRAEEAKLSAPDTQAGWLQRLCLERLRAHEAADELPTSLRFIYYELKPQLPTDLPSPKRIWGQNISDATMVLRMTGLVPWWWINDETRALTTWRSASSVYAYAVEAVKVARIDCWAGERPPMILAESRSLAGILDERIAAAYLCPIAPTNGQVGGFLYTDVIPALHENQRVLYLGDLNAAGTDIETNTRAVIEQQTGPLRWERLLLTPAQGRRYRLPSKETTDRRARLDALLPEPLERVRVREARQRRDVARRLSR